MKKFIRILISIFAFSYGCTAFSAASNVEDCPPVFSIKNVQFTSASKIGTGWILTHNIGHWDVNLILDLEEANTSEEALAIGQQYYNTKVTFFSSPIETDIFCIYAMTNDYEVFASPFKGH